MTVWEVDPLEQLAAFGADELRRVHLEHRDTEAGVVLFWAWQVARALEDPHSDSRVAAQLASIGNDGNGTRSRPGKIVNVRQAAELIGCKERNVVHLLSQGKLRGHLVRGAWEIDRVSVDELLDARERGYG